LDLTTAKDTAVQKTWLRNWVVDILPYLDQQDLANAWDSKAWYFNPDQTVTGQPANLQVSNTALAVLRCPNDSSAQNGVGNLSYVVNGGFAFFAAANISFTGGLPSAPTPVNPSFTAVDWASPIATAQGTANRLGVMFLGSSTGGFTWDYKTTPGAVSDGMGNTLLLSENTLAGADSSGNTIAGGVTTNWACPLPNFCMFIGSPKVCGTAGTCATSPVVLQADFSTNPPTDGSYWSEANKNSTANNDYINGGQNLTTEGTFPFSNSGHPAGCNMVFTDGSARFISATIDGTV